MNDEREQLMTRYIAGKVLDGASAEEIAHGVIDPVEDQLCCEPGEP